MTGHPEVLVVRVTVVRGGIVGSAGSSKESREMEASKSQIRASPVKKRRHRIEDRKPVVLNNDDSVAGPAEQTLLSAAERRGTPVLLSASVSDNSGNSPQMAAPRRSCEIDQSTQRFHVGCDNQCLFGNEYGRLHGC